MDDKEQWNMAWLRSAIESKLSEFGWSPIVDERGVVFVTSPVSDGEYEISIREVER